MKTCKHITGRSQRFFSAAHSHSPVLSTLAVVILATLAFMSGPAQAQVSGLSGAVAPISRADLTAIGSVDVGALTSDTAMRMFLEKQDVELTAAMTVDITANGTYGTPLTPGTLGAGKLVTSVMIHSDRTDPNGNSNLTGAIEFNTNILGVVIADGTLDSWDSVVGGGGVTYPTGLQYRGLEYDGAAFPSPDEVVLVAGNRLELNLNTSSWVDQLRVIVAANPRGVSFSIDAHGPSNGLAPAFGPGLIDAGDILTPGQGGSPGPNRPVPGPTVAPGVMLRPIDLGITLAGMAGVKEVDALSFGRDRGRRLHFSVDEYAIGTAVGPAVSVFSEGAIGNQEASADVFSYMAPLAPTNPAFQPGNRAVIDGDGVAPTSRPGVGLIEPNAPTLNTAQDNGDNLDALDMGTEYEQLSGRVFFSLDARYADWAESAGGSPPNYGTAWANGVRGADVLVTVPGSGVVMVYASAAQLGLDCDGDNDGVDCEDDIDALAIYDDGDGQYNPNNDQILFSLRRGSLTLGTLDTRLGLPITEADVLAPGPAIIIPGESLGLDTARWGVNSPYQVADDLDALDRIPSSGAPVSQDDNAAAAAGMIVVIDVLANDAALDGELDPSTVMVFGAPQYGEIVSIDEETGAIHFRVATDGSDDEFTYVVGDDQGNVSELATVSVVTGITGVDGPGRGQTRFAFAGPNPMQNQTSFRLMPARSGPVSVVIYDMVGRKVRTLLDGSMQAGEIQELAWNGRDDSGRSTATGMYFVRMQSADGQQMLRVVRMK